MLRPLGIRDWGGGEELSRFHRNMTTAAVYLMAQVPRRLTSETDIEYAQFEAAWTMWDDGDEVIAKPTGDYYSTLPDVHVPRDPLELFGLFLSTLTETWQDSCSITSRLLSILVRLPLPARNIAGGRRFHLYQCANTCVPRTHGSSSSWARIRAS